jgi:hypothetical protein
MAAASSVAGVGDSSEEEVESDEDEVIDLLALNLPNRQWTTESYSNARSVNQYHTPRDTNVQYSTTQVQQDAFFGHMVKKTVFSHQTIDLAYMSNQAVMANLVARFENMGLSNFFRHRWD